MSIDFRSVALRQDRSIIARRWLATWLDFIFLTGAIWGAILVQGRGLFEPLQTPAWALILGMVPAYYFGCEGLWHATPGKLICGIRVVAPTGGMSWWLRIAVRTALRLIEVNPFLLGGAPAGIVALITPTKQRLGDLCAGTYVIEVDHVRAAGPDPWKVQRQGEPPPPERHLVSPTEEES